MIFWNEGSVQYIVFLQHPKSLELLKLNLCNRMPGKETVSKADFPRFQLFFLPHT